ncbi:MAG TPA: proline dehydrogenase family protein [Pyrinomonadaceae bacterium]|nr:proline dehydrogenase family protein [Pyrinomonadaceae bacterium]
MPRLDFGNTKLAFKTKSKKELKRAYWLFRLIAPFRNDLLASAGMWIANLITRLRLPLLRVPLDMLFNHFCGGRTIEDCRETISTLAQSGIKTTLDYCIEALEDEADLHETTSEILRNIAEARNDRRIPFCVFKVTSVGRSELLEKMSAGSSLLASEASQYSRIEERIDSICKSALDSDVRVLIDAEESWLQTAIDDLAVKAMERYNTRSAVVFNTFQMYRKDRLEFLQQSYERAAAAPYFLGVKLVRGAYLERERMRATRMKYPSPVHDTKFDTDTAYNLALKFCVKNMQKIALYVGTHNQESIQLLIDSLERDGIPRDASSVYLSQLFGMGDNITYALASEGYNVAKFVPYGKLELALPYLLRRARENSAVRGEVGRELELIVREMTRRRKQTRYNK